MPWTSECYFCDKFQNVSGLRSISIVNHHPQEIRLEVQRGANPFKRTHILVLAAYPTHSLVFDDIGHFVVLGVFNSLFQYRSPEPSTGFVFQFSLYMRWSHGFLRILWQFRVQLALVQIGSLPVSRSQQETLDSHRKLEKTEH